MDLNKLDEALKNFGLKLYFFVIRNKFKYIFFNFKDKAIKNNPSYASSYNNKGFLLAFKMKKYDEAINFYSKAIEINPKCAEYYLGKGFCLHNIDRCVEAISTYKKAAEYNSNDPTIFNNIGCSYLKVYFLIKLMFFQNSFLYFKILTVIQI